MAQSGPRSEPINNDTSAGVRPAATMNLGTLRNVLLVRIACAGADGIARAQVRADLAPMVEHRLTAAEWRRDLDQLVFTLLAEGLVVTQRMRLTASDTGRAAVVQFLGAPLPARAEWTEVRDIMLVGRALGIEVGQGARRKKLESAQGLRGAILEHSFGLPAAASRSVPGLRDTLARRAAPRGQQPTKTRSKNGANPTIKARRAVERLLRRPREFASDAALLAELAAEQVGAQQTSVPSLRKAILRKLIGRPIEFRPVEIRPVETRSSMLRASPTEADWLGTSARPSVAAAMPPDASTFCRIVTHIARSCAEGWDGNRRAYICNVWRGVAEAHPEWGLAIDDFKSRLVEAHKAGGLTLAYADLRNKDNIELVQASAVRDRNNEWHFVRVTD